MAMEDVRAADASALRIAADAKPGKIRILMVDDQPANLVALESMLGDPDFELVKARSGNDALRALLKQDFALVLLDVFMPGLDGFGTASMIHRRKRSMHTPIIFISAGSMNDTHVSRGYSLGAVDYIYKPIVPEILKAKVQVFADLYRKTERLARSEEALRRELEEHKRAEEARRESEARYRELFAGASDAIVVLDAASGAVLDANKAALKLFGHARKDLPRLRAKQLAGDAETAAELGRAPADRTPSLRRLKAKNGRVFPAEVTRAALTVNGHDLVMLLARDMTEREKAEETERLRHRETMQRRFVATVSHELRTPVAVIKASAETLRRGAPDPKDVRFLRIIENHADHLTRLVEDLLVLAEFESGVVHPAPRPVALHEVIEDLIEGLRPLAARRSVTIDVSSPAKLDVFVDPGHLARILQNLVDNAIKYNKKGGAVTVTARRAGTKLAEVVIADTGIGIPADEMPRIFEQFHRTSRAKAQRARGTGLGLYIIKSLVESNGGTIRAEHVESGGTAFHFTLPLAEKC